MQILQLCYAKQCKGFTVITETILSAVEIQHKIVYSWLSMCDQAWSIQSEKSKCNAVTYNVKHITVFSNSIMFFKQLSTATF